MEYVIRILTFALIPLIVSGVLALLRRPKKTEKGKVCLPIALAIVGVICSAAFLIPTFICAFSDESKETAPVFLVLSMLCASLIVAYINCRISYDEDGFTAKNFFGIKRRFSYDQITGIKENMHESYLYMGKRRIMIDEFATGGMEFIWLANKKYRKLYRKPIPEKITKDIFNGNIESPGEFLFVFILVGAVCIGISIFTCCFIFESNTESTTINRQAVFQSFRMEDDTLILQASDGEIYKISHADKLQTEKITSVCDGKTEVTVYGKQYKLDEGITDYAVKAIANRDIYLLSFRETNRLERLEALPVFLILLVINSIWGIFVAGAIIVGRNPTKYSPHIVKIFFKPEYVKNYSDVIRQYALRKRK